MKGIGLPARDRAVRGIAVFGTVATLTVVATGWVPVLAARPPAASLAGPNSGSTTRYPSHPCLCTTSTVGLAGGKGRVVPKFRALEPSLDAAQNAPTQNPSLSDNGAYTALSPTRLLDTRTDGGPLGPGQSLNLSVVGGSVPSDASAVALNVTVTDTTAGSYLSVYPAGEARPLLSNLNWPPGKTVPNLVIVPVGLDGKVTFYNDLGDVDIVVDLEGYFAPEPSDTSAGSYVPLTPTRIADTRPNSGEPDAGTPLGPNGTLNVQVNGIGGVPSTGVAAVLMNVTVTDTTAASYLTAYPQGQTQPLASNLNWVKGETVANRVVVPVGHTGEVSLYNQLGQTDVVVDVDGYFTSGVSAPTDAGLFSSISPVRVLDTRVTGPTLGPGQSLSQPLAGIDGIGATATAVVANVTVVDTTAPSYLTVYPGPTRPLASDLNWLPGQIVANLTVATLGANGTTSAFNDQGSTNVIIDAFGYFGPRVPLTITTTSVPEATKGSLYSTDLQATGGTAPYSWTLTSGSLPSGLSLTSGGSIEGTPTASGTYTFGVEVTDSTTPTAQRASAQLDLTVIVAPLSISTTSLPKAVVDATYSATLTATGGTPPYQWALTSGAMPQGLSLSSSGVISGTPTSAGTASFEVTATDSSGPPPETAIAQLSIQVDLTEQTFTSYNWSGYAVQGSQTAALGATSVTGTFTVPGLTYATSCSDVMSVWNGIDGASNDYLIQAGVELATTVPYGSGAGSCTPGDFYIVPWWEVITPTNPAPETYIETWDSGSQAVINPGDQVTVTINQVSLGAWNIILTDDTTGGTFDYAQYYGSDVSYTGPGASAEWIVEDTDQPDNPNCTWPGNGVYLCPMPAYNPPVTFSEISFKYTGVYAETDQMYMVDQSDNVVSEPSSLGTSGNFTVSYVGSGTNAPNRAVTLETLGSRAPTVAHVSPAALSPRPYRAP